MIIVCPCLSWRMSYYEIMFLLFKVIIYISERTSIIWEISGDAASFRKTKVLVQLGKLRWGCAACLTLPNPTSGKICNLLSLMSAVKKETYHIQELCFRKDKLTLFHST